MKNVGVRELKNRLSAYIRQVKQGEIVRVTERGKAVAILKKEPACRIDQQLEALENKGLLRMGEGGKPWGLASRRKAVKGAPLSRSVIEERR